MTGGQLIRAPGCEMSWKSMALRLVPPRPSATHRRTTLTRSEPHAVLRGRVLGTPQPGTERPSVPLQLPSLAVKVHPVENSTHGMWGPRPEQEQERKR